MKTIPDIFSIEPVVQYVHTKGKCSVAGLVGSSRTLFIAQLLKHIEQCIAITENDNVETMYHELKGLDVDTSIVNSTHPFYAHTRVVVTTNDALTQSVHETTPVTIHRGQSLEVDWIIAALERSGYVREDIVEDEHEYAVRGGIVDLYEPDGEPLRLEFYGDIVYSIRKFDTQNQRSFEEIEQATIYLAHSDSTSRLTDISDDKIWFIAFTPCNDFHPHIQVQQQGEIDYHLTSTMKYYGDLRRLKNDISRGSYNYRFYIGSSTLIERLQTVLGAITAYQAPLVEGFTDALNKYIHLTETEIFGTPIRKKRVFKGLFIDDLMALKENDYVVHADYGIGQFKELTYIELEGRSFECLRIDYAGNDKVYLPIERLNLLERYIASHDHPPPLSKLGSGAWIRTKKRIKKATERLAIDLLQLYARRAQQAGFAFSADTLEMKELVLSFPYEETPDQQQAITDVFKDMETARPAERLICGDVGYGKTEIALRAAFKAALDGKQTMLLCPTTLLAFQHFNTFTTRLTQFPVSVAMVSRFVAKKELVSTLQNIASGHIDIVIGTHRLLQPDVKFRDLGVLIIDEEQRFGVAQKEKIRNLKPSVDTFSLSATPIPRTLYMALAGLKNISTIHTPPSNRKDIHTKIFYYDEDELKSIIEHEYDRRGQVFFIHNRIQTIETIRKKLQRIVPELKICVLHGQMKEAVTEHRMIEFLNGAYDILLSTAIVESGLDMPRVNTIIVDNAHMFGLADLHQLRGRVGRSSVQAYAYFIVPSHGHVSEEAHKRLSALASYTSLGSGFRLALRDMEIRGVGNLLGREQSGNIDTIGYHLYMKMLNISIQELQGYRVTYEPVLDLKLEAYFPLEYIESGYERSALYKRMLNVESQTELDAIKGELIDRFGKYPDEVANLFILSSIRVRAREWGAHEVVRRGENVLYYRDGIIIKTEELNIKSKS